MRLWTLHPRYLDRQGLVALWREALLAQKVLQGQTTGYRHHPQLVRFRAMPDPVAVRGTGSAAFIGGTLLAGQAVSAWGLGVIVGLQAMLLGAAAGAARRAPELRQARTGEAVRAPAGGVRRLLRLPQFHQLVLVAALVLGSHAMHDAFAVIRWCSLVNCRG